MKHCLTDPAYRERTANSINELAALVGMEFVVGADKVRNITNNRIRSVFGMPHWALYMPTWPPVKDPIPKK